MNHFLTHAWIFHPTESHNKTRHRHWHLIWFIPYIFAYFVNEGVYIQNFPVDDSSQSKKVTVTALRITLSLILWDRSTTPRCYTTRHCTVEKKPFHRLPTVKCTLVIFLYGWTHVQWSKQNRLGWIPPYPTPTGHHRAMYDSVVQGRTYNGKDQLNQISENYVI